MVSPWLHHWNDLECNGILIISYLQLVICSMMFMSRKIGGFLGDFALCLAWQGAKIGGETEGNRKRDWFSRLAMFSCEV